MAHLQRFHERRAGDRIFVFAIAMLEDGAEAQRLTRGLGATYPIFWGTGSDLGHRFAYG